MPYLPGPQEANNNHNTNNNNNDNNDNDNNTNNNNNITNSIIYNDNNDNNIGTAAELPLLAMSLSDHRPRSNREHCEERNVRNTAKHPAYT